MATRKKSTNSFYSYSAKRTLRQEEIQAYRRITFATLLVIGLIVGGYFLGVPLLANLGSGGNTDQITPLGSTDSIAPAAPQIGSLPDYTNSRKLTISGTAESGSTVTIKVNDTEALSALSDKDGLFTGEISLDGGENTIIAFAKDAAGNQSRDSKQYTIVYDATPPSLVLLQELPENAQEQEVTVSGKTEPGAKVTVNQRQAVVNGDGVFNYKLSLKSGENVIEIIAEDAAQNTRKLNRTVNFTSSDDDDKQDSKDTEKD